MRTPAHTEPRCRNDKDGKPVLGPDGEKQYEPHKADVILATNGHLHCVNFDDGDIRWYCMKDERWQQLEAPSAHSRRQCASSFWLE